MAWLDTGFDDERVVVCDDEDRSKTRVMVLYDSEGSLETRHKPGYVCFHTE